MRKINRKWFSIAMLALACLSFGVQPAFSNPLTIDQVLREARRAADEMPWGEIPGEVDQTTAFVAIAEE